jgi:hypothetical protein
MSSAGLSLLLLFLAGCANFSAARHGSTELLNGLFPQGTVEGPRSAEAQVRISYGGRGVSLPAAAAFRPPSDIRIDILDPLDRPVAMIFLRNGQIVQYRPGDGVAAAVTLFPEGCRNVDAGAWAGYAFGTGPDSEVRKSFRPPWLGLQELLRYSGGALAERIVYRKEGGRLRLKKVEWYCRGDVAMTLSPEDDAGKGLAWGGSIAFPLGGLSIDLEVGEVMGLPGIDESFFRPRLPAATRWLEWRMADER